ncbi:MAG: glycogen synthase GlgA [Gammaproteobacteria bacterium]|nr:glycogen synthase GlgA [Gammaproteobacteria bacterium]
MKHVLFAASEAHPLIKTGGLGDVAGSLPAALAELGDDVRLIMPAYRPLLQKLDQVEVIANFTIAATADKVRLLAATLPGEKLPLILVDFPPYFDRDGNPYLNDSGTDWHDNAERFALFCRAIVEVAMGRVGLSWKADIVHCNDWQTGLVPALLSLEEPRPATLFTIHNLAYQGRFFGEMFHRLNLPHQLWGAEGLEFYNDLSFIKGGLFYADRINAVSPTYAEEICTPEFGYGLDGLLNSRRSELSGIINGIDYHVWDPETDPHIAAHYNADSLHLKQGNKIALQQQLGLPMNRDIPLLGSIGRLVGQKGIDLFIEIIPDLLSSEEVQIAFLGTGSHWIESQLRKLQLAYPDKIALVVGYNETLAHLIEAGADIFVMPSRFEPCGLNQLFSLRYGTPPLVRFTGGLADTVIHSNEATINDGTASGFIFDEANPQQLRWTLGEALALYHQPWLWQQIQRNAMQHDYSWRESARRYDMLYQEMIKQPFPHLTPTDNGEKHD